MKNILFCLILLFVTLVSCYDNYELENHNVNQHLTLIHNVSMEEALDSAINFLILKKKESPISKSNVLVDDKYTKKTTIIRKVSNDNIITKSGNEIEDIPVYIFDFFTEEGKPNGYVVKIGDSRFKNTVFSYSENTVFGNFEGPGGDYWLNWMDGYIYGIINNKINVQGTKALENKQVKLDMPTSWEQGVSPYWDCCPISYGLNKKTKVGCVPLAIGQIMAYYKWPIKGAYKKKQYNDYPGYYNFTLTSYDWPKMTSNPIGSLIPSNYKYMISDLLSEIGYKINVQYGTDGTSVNGSRIRSDIPAVLNRMGYNKNIIIDNTLNYDIISNEIISKRPILVNAYDSDNAGHAFLITGYGYSGSINGFQYFWVTAGGAGRQDGWYMWYDNFFHFAYRYNVTLFRNIIPNRNATIIQDDWSVR